MGFPQLLAAAVISVAAAVVTQVPPSAGSPDPRLVAVRELLRESRFEEAEPVARAWVRDRADDPRAGFYLGLVLHKAKRHGEAKAFLERAAAAPAGAFPEAVHASHYLGWCLYYLGDLDGAKASFTVHARAFPRYDDDQFALGIIAYDEDRLDDAEARFRLAIELLGAAGAPKERAKNLARLGDVLLRRDRLGDAEACYREAIRLHEMNGEAWSKLARVLDRQGRADEAQATRARQAELKSRADAGSAP
jgi:tetratricopeptide (TPR) repeat protein